MVPPGRETKNAGFFKVFFHALTAKRQPGQSFGTLARARFTEQEVDAAKSVAPISAYFCCPAVLVDVRPNELHVGVAGLQNGPVNILGTKFGAADAIHEPVSWS